MFEIETLLLGLLISSTVTGLVTEAVKKILNEFKVDYYANTLVGIVSLFLSAGVGVGYVIFTGENFTSQVIVSIVAMVFANWLCAMVGYDKVVQAISQFKTKKEGTTNE